MHPRTALRRPRAWLHLSLSLGLAALGVAIGCSSSTGGGSGGAPIAESQLCSRQADVYCSVAGPCCQAAGTPVDAALCRQLVIAECEDKRTSAHAAGRVYDARAAGTCLGGLPGTIRNCQPLDDDAAEVIFDACDAIWVGATPLGGACSTSRDCAPSADGAQVTCGFSSTPGDAMVGACALVRVAKLGEPCGALPDAGVSYVPCASGLVCDRPTSGDAGSEERCLTRGSVGAPCQSSGHCVSGLTCPSATHVCSAPAADGASCEPYESYACGEQSWCDTTTKRCAPLPGAGTACATGHYPSCAEGTYCDDADRCVAAKAAGQPCGGDDECATGYCGAASVGGAETCRADPGIATPSTCSGDFGG